MSGLEMLCRVFRQVTDVDFGGELWDVCVSISFGDLVGELGSKSGCIFRKRPIF